MSETYRPGRVLGVTLWVAAAWAVAAAPASGQEQTPGTAAAPADRPVDPLLKPLVWAPKSGRPASELVLIKLGDKAVITQEDVNRAMHGRTMAWIERNRDQVIRQLVKVRLFELYVNDHPELVDQSALDAHKQQQLSGEIKTPEQFDEKMKQAGSAVRFEDIYRDWKFLLVQRALIRASRKELTEENMQRLWEEKPREWNDTRVKLRHIEISFEPWETAEQIEAKRRLLERLREDLLAGRITWEQAVQHSDNRSRITNGDMGWVPRHGERPEQITEVAFKLKTGEISDIVETTTGLNLLQAVDWHDGRLPFEKAKRNMIRWLNEQGMMRAGEEIRKAYPVVGVQPPEMPPQEILAPATAPAGEGPVPIPGLPKFQPPDSATRPGAATRPAAGRRAVTTRPAMTRPARTFQRPPTTRPAAGARPATQPAPGRGRPAASPRPLTPTQPAR